MLLKIAFFYLVFLTVPAAVLLGWFGFRSRRIWLKVPLLLLAVVHVLLATVSFKDRFLTRNHSDVDRTIVLEDWDGVNDGLHNSNTDLIDFDGSLFLIHQASPFHLGTDQARLVIRRSEDDGRTWEYVTEIDGGDLDIRDPKFLIVGDRLYLYVLMNVELNPEPFTTLFTWSSDGRNWTPLEETGHPEWLFWRPRNIGGTYFVPAYYYEHGRSILLHSEDGENWTRYAEIYEGGRNDETAVAVLPDGTMIATARLEYSDSVFGHRDGSTLISRSMPPYRNFEALTEDNSNRLDGPALFVHDDRIFALARWQPKKRMPWQRIGSAFTRKRTALFEVTEEGLVWLSDLPSTGDTSYGGIVMRGDEALVCYYTSDIRKEFVWFTGLLSPSPIRMARIDLDALAAKADRK